MRIGTRPAVGLVVTLLLALASVPTLAQRRSELPLVRVAAPAGTSGPMILLLSGDGDWAPFADMRTYVKVPTMATHRAPAVMPAGSTRGQVTYRDLH